MKERIFNSMLELIGGTPLVRVNRMSEVTGAEVIAKLEYFNPMSSVKDRVALAMVEGAEKKGLLKKGSVIVEPTSGNTGIGLAFVCAVKGYRLILTMPETMSVERRKLLKVLGAEVILTPGDKGMQGSIEFAGKLASENDNYLILQQFSNQANPEIHEKTTAMEICEDCDGKIDFFIAGVGTGGTLSGTGRVLKKKNPAVKIIAVEPADSPVLSGGNPGPHDLQGIGAGFIPAVYDKSVVDEIITVTTEEAFSEARMAVLDEGIFCGISSGAALSAARKVAMRPENKGKRIVVLIPDTGGRYLSTALFE